jgi:trigger factor
MEVKTKIITNKNLKKDYQFSVTRAFVSSKVDEYIEKIKKNVNLDGFRKGKVPTAIIKEKFGASIMSDECEKIVNEQVKNIIKNNDFKLALQPKVDIKNLSALDSDLEFTASFELFPEVPEIDFDKIKVVKKEVEISESDVSDAISKLAKFHCKWNVVEDSQYKAKLGDAANIDYVGKIDKKEFDGGSANSYQLELGSKNFIDDFEEQLVGKRSGDAVRIKVKFPKNYHNQEFQGKSAEFDVKINNVLTAEFPKITDEFIKNTFGVEHKQRLEEILKKQIENNYNQISCDAFKKELFDFLNKKYDFDLPEGMVDEELNRLWSQVEEELKSNPTKFKNEKEKKKAKNEQRKIAEKMIRCGIVISEIAKRNKIESTNDDINKEIGKIFTKFAGQEKNIIDFYQKNPSAISSLKSKIIEEKTVDFIAQKNSVEKKKMSTKEFDKMLKKMNEID